MRLLLVEDDPTLGEGLRDFLRSEGYRVDWAQTLAGTAGLAAEPFDVWLLDWSLPDGSGVAWLAGQRARGVATPAIVLTARDRLADRIHGLDSGADDFLVKPFAPEELVARLRALARRMGGPGGATRHFGAVDVDLGARQVALAGTRVDLTAREWQILEALVLRAGRIVTKPELDALATGFDGEASSNAVEVHVSNLRRKLGRGLIETVRGLGYRVAR